MVEFRTNGTSNYRALDDDRQARITRGLKRDWERHSELRSQYGGNFKRYVAANRGTTFCG